MATGDLDLRWGDDIDVVFDHGLGVVLGHRLAKSFLTPDLMAELSLQQPPGCLPGPEARHPDLLRNALERSIDGGIELRFVDLDVELHPVLFEGLDSALHDREA